MTMKSQFNGLPLPAFEVNNELLVVDCSMEAEELFGECRKFTDIVDADSLQKAKKLLRIESSL
ncbi:hypothetical protein QWY16_14255 [Planococcus shenhongbingii]|nr:hypothetical protein [Planococcus sp. N016]WKA57653.1 hypothetical protein QWY16_14255 [Planococcus sp. N016]